MAQRKDPTVLPSLFVSHGSPLLPLFVALGAGRQDAERLHASAAYGFLRMDIYAYGARDSG